MIHTELYSQHALSQYYTGYIVILRILYTLVPSYSYSFIMHMTPWFNYSLNALIKALNSTWKMVSMEKSG